MNNQIQKTQLIRLMDVGIFGPLMIYTALNKKPPKIITNSLILIGLGTIIYNGYNYIEQLKQQGKDNAI